MDWPSAADYGEAVQNLKHSMRDKELRAGDLAVTPLGMPMLWAGGLADVYKIHNPRSGNTWALKCFTRKVTEQEERYRHISAHLKQARLPFMVDFTYLSQGVYIHGEWFPVLKMRWVEGGIRLNDFVEEYLDRPQTLRDLLRMWPKMALRLRKAEVTHADLQHGNVLLVPRSDRRLALRLIDYDGMHVPALKSTPSAELGHPAFQHPQRSREGIYSSEVDRFSHLAICSAIQCLTVGGQELWDRFNNGDNLLFREADFQSPADSEVFHSLWELPDEDCRAWVGRLALACQGPLEHTPLLDGLTPPPGQATNGYVIPLTPSEKHAAEQLLGSIERFFQVATAWPSAEDFGEAVRNLLYSVGDEELCNGTLAVTPLGLPKVWVGEYAQVYRIHNAKTGHTWALKCFTRKVADRANRYQHISAHLEQARLPFMVDFTYLDRGIRVRGKWYPALKMRWVEGGIKLNDFVEENLERPETLRELLQLWAGMARRLQEAQTAHADLEPSNVLLVPASDGRLGLRLIDYDGMHVPGLSGKPSAELGHPAYQHPQRTLEGTYSPEVDRFSQLVICCAIRCLAVGGQKLWERFNKGDNLLFREQDFLDPARSEIFHALWELPDDDCRALVRHLLLACQGPLVQTPLLDEVMPQSNEAADAHAQPLTPLAADAVELYRGDTKGSFQAATAERARAEASLQNGAPKPAAPSVVSGRMSFLAFARWIDRLLETFAGEGNSVIHGFLRFLGVVGFLVLLGFFAYGLSGSVTAWMASVERAEIPLAAAGPAVEGPNPRETPPEPVTLPEYTNAIGMKFKLIPAGTFLMGSPEADPDRRSDEIPQHTVRITEPFYLGVTEVTNAQFEQITGYNPALDINQLYGEGPSYPVIFASWEEATAFCMKLSELDIGNEYRLPTEAQWEYACRADATTRYNCGNELGTEYAWFFNLDNPAGRPQPVGQKRPNAWGLHDMHGNVAEWCQDWYDSEYYARCESDDPAGPSAPSPSSIGSDRVIRGGYGMPPSCRSAARGKEWENGHNCTVGFRVALVRGTAMALAGGPTEPSEPASPPDTLSEPVAVVASRTLEGHAQTVQSVAFSPDGRRIVSGSADKSIRVWDADTGHEIMTLEGHGGIVTSVAYSPDGQVIGSGNQDQTIKIWDANTGREIKSFEQRQNVMSVAFSPNGWWIASAGSGLEQKITIWDTNTGQNLRTLEVPYYYSYDVAIFTYDGRRIIGGGIGDSTRATRHGSIGLWDADTGGQLMTLDGHAIINSVAASPDGRWFASGGSDNKVRLWDMDTGEEFRTLEGHRKPVRSLAIGPNGKRIVSGSFDKTVKVWDAESGRLIGSLDGHTVCAMSVAISPDGRRIASGGYDNTVRVWDLPEELWSDTSEFVNNAK